MNEFQVALYESVVFSYGKTLAKYNVFDQEVILRDIGESILQYLADKGFVFEEKGDVQDIERSIAFFVEHGFSKLDVRKTSEGDEFVWRDLFGRDAYEKLQDYAENPFLSCPLNAAALFVASKYNKSLKLQKKDFSDPSGTVVSIETIVNQEEGEGSFSPLVIENARLIELAEEKNRALERANHELKELKQKYVQRQKMDALGTLVGGVAHNFNNILAGMIGKAYLAMRNETSEANQVYLQDIQGLGERAAEMVSQLLVFSHAGSVERKDVLVTSLYKDVIDLVKIGLPENITLHVDIAEDLVVSGDSNELQQLLINLVNNARDAVAEMDKKEISIKLYAQPALGYQYKDECKVCVNDAVCLTVEDSGEGISEDNLKKIYDPFFTTKCVGEGTGLGLATVYGTVESHDANIIVESAVGKGTTFMVCFQRVDSGNVQEKYVQEVMQAEERTTILIVDDEPVIRETFGQIFEDLGYATLQAEDGLQAIEVFRQHQESIQLVISDAIMPRLGGCECLGEIKKIKPDVAAILISGYSEMEATKKLQCDDIEVLAKPVNVAELSKKVFDILADKKEEG